MARHRTPHVARLLAACVLITLVVSTAPTRAQDEGAEAVDITAPVVAQPAEVFGQAVDATGGPVTYVLPDAVDETDGPVPVSCSPASGSWFPLLTSTVTCEAFDKAGNPGTTSFPVTVVDVSPPVVQHPGDIYADAVAGVDTSVVYRVVAIDNVDGVIGTTCNIPSGSVFKVGTTAVTCTAVDAAGKLSESITFVVVVNPPPPVPTAIPTAVPTAVPTSTEVPTKEPTAKPEKPDATSTPRPTDEPDATRTPRPAKTPRPTDIPASADTPVSTETPSPTATTTVTPTATSSVTPTPTVTPTATATRESTPQALDLPWPPPESFTLVGDGGPVGGLAMMWENRDYPISQEFGHTWFSVRHGGWYAYGRAYGLDGYEHTGLDIGMPRGTPLYSPVAGTVKIAGGTPYFTYYGNGQPGVGELLIETDAGHEVVLGHMGLITVEVGDRVEVGEFVGLSGGDNGDHLHLEVRQAQGGGLRLVDPRRSFLVAVIEDAIATQAGEGAVASSRRSDEADEPEGTPAPDDDPEELTGPR